MKSFLMIGSLLILLAGLSSCAYRFGYDSHKMPSGYEQILIPMFINETMVVGAEVHFTNELKNQFYRSKVAEISSNAPVKIVGKIRRIYVDQTRARANAKDYKNLPSNTVLTTSYNMTVDLKVEMIRLEDKKVIWQSSFSEYLPYSGAQLRLEGLGASNAMYNQSALDLNIRDIAETLMAEVHSRLTENF